MSLNPVITVVVPNFNHANFLSKRLDSILNQTYQDFEVILLDDASTDNSVEILNKYAIHQKIEHLIVNDRNSGSPFLQWKKGIELARGEYIWIAESDDWADKSLLEVMLAKMESDEELGLVYCRSYRTDEKGELYGFNQWGEQLDPELWLKNQSFEKKEFIDKYLQFRNVIPNVSAVLFRKERILIDDEVTNMKLCGDWLLYSKMAIESKMGYVATPLNFFRRYETSTTFRDITISKEKKRIREYLKVIRFNLNVTGNRLSDSIDQYSWIVFGWINNRNLRKKFPISFFFPNLPKSLLLFFYKKIFQKVIHV